MKVILRSSQLSYELLEKIALQIRVAKEKESAKFLKRNEKTA